MGSLQTWKHSNEKFFIIKSRPKFAHHTYKFILRLFQYFKWPAKALIRLCIYAQAGLRIWWLLEIHIAAHVRVETALFDLRCSSFLPDGFSAFSDFSCLQYLRGSHPETGKIYNIATTWDFQQCGMCLVWSEPLLAACVVYVCSTTDWTSFGVSNLKGRLHRLVWAYTYQNATVLEITCHSSYVVGKIVVISQVSEVTIRHFGQQSGLEVLKLEFILRLKIKHNDWLLADTCRQATNQCALFWVWDCTPVLLPRGLV